MKSILFFSGIYPPDIGGPATFIPQMEMFLTSIGRKYHTVTLRNQRGRSRIRHPQLTSISRRIPIPFRMAQVVYEGLISIRDKDVVLANGLYEEAAVVACLSRKPLISKVVGVPAWEAFRHSQLDKSNLSHGLELFDKSLLPLALKIRNTLWEWSLRKSSLIITPSEELSAYIKSIGIGTTVQVVANGTEIEPLVAYPHHYDVVTTVRLVPWKNVDILILAAKRFGFTLAIVGDGPELGRLQSLADGDEKIFFLGALDRPSLTHVVATSRIFSLVSSYEGLSYALIQAWSLGKASVLSVAKGNVDAIKGFDVSICVPVRNVEATGIAIRTLLEDEVLRRAKETEARRLAETHYDKRKQLNQVLRMIDGD